jgi:two-component system, OmpR family, phosphate regulon sensor histidine kinase PhoR
VAPTDSSLLDLIRTPALIVKAGLIDYANFAAIDLLGGHIVGQDVRIAIRAPDAVEIINSQNGGSVSLIGLSVPGSIWHLTCHPIASGDRLLLLDDISVRSSVARSHADFVANASHELRTPLASILGYVETLENPAAGGDVKTRERFLNIIRAEAIRMQALVEDLMSLSRIEAVKHEEPSERIDIVELANIAAKEIGNANVKVVTNAAVAIVVGDKGQMAQVFRNLIDNAIKYGTPDGLVSIGFEATDTGWVSVSVHNDGDAIASEHLPRLTERFYRADAGRSRAAGGTGLGLSIVKHIIERHRGRFDLVSHDGQGTSATFLLRLAKD